MTNRKSGGALRLYAAIGWITLMAQGAWAGDRVTDTATSREQTGTVQIESATSWSIGPLPATYQGDLPAADGPGIRYHLDLFPDHVYFLRMTYLGRPDRASFDDIGTWSVSSDGMTLVLRGGREAPIMFALKGARILRKLDLEGREIVTQLNYDLTRAAQFSPIEARVMMRGMYSYMADAGLFQECSTRRKFPVAQAGDNAALESAYSKARRQPGEALLVNLNGLIAARPRVEGEGSQDTLVVERFIGVWPGETCGAQFSTAILENTYWKLVRLGDNPVTVHAHQREPHLILRPGQERQVAGSTGCNRVIGRYDRGEGQTLRFGGMATTKMACLEGMEQEQAFLKAVEAVARWKIVGERLELFDSEGHFLARFEARHMN